VLILLRLTYITYTIFQIYPQSNSLKNLLAGFRGSGIYGVYTESPGFPDIPDLARRLRVIKV
jgi:hypothetical protein